jgi:hypothetical protein
MRLANLPAATSAPDFDCEGARRSVASLISVDEEQGPEVDHVEYRTISASLRAPRFAVAYRPGRDWVYTARRVMASVSRVWAGMGAAVLPVGADGDALPQTLGLLRTYDPDVVAEHVPVLADLAASDATVVERAVERFSVSSESRETAWERLFGRAGPGWRLGEARCTGRRLVFAVHRCRAGRKLL